MGGVSEWLNLATFLGPAERGPYSPYKPINDSLYIGIIIFPHIDNPQSTGHNLLLIYLLKKDIKKETQKSEGTH